MSYDEYLDDLLGDLDAKRPPLDVSNDAVMADWLRMELGTGLLSGMFARGDRIVHTPREGEDGYEPLTEDKDDSDGPAQVRVATPDYIAARIQYSYSCYRTSKKFGKQPSLFPVAAARIATNAVDKLTRLRRLNGIIHTPVVRRDGSILDTPGYDPATKLLYLPEPGMAVLKIPETPQWSHVEAAIALINEMIHDFPFVTDHDRANYWGLLLTPMLRAIIPPPYKMGAFEARQPGSGKTLLANTIRYIHGGVFRAEMPEDDAELRKQISTILDVTTGPVVLIDNVSGMLRSSTMAGLLTSSTWDDRKLGTMKEMIRRPNDRLWLITGNNLAIGGDLPRRTLRCTIDPGVPHPELRTNFAINGLEDWIHRRRSELIAALLIIIRSWAITGKPLTGQQSSDGYARWIRIIGGVLAHIGVPGEFGHHTTRVEVGADDDEWHDFLAAAWRVFGDESWTAKELLGRVETTTWPNNPDFAAKPIPMDALPGPLHEKVTKARDAGPQVIARSLGMWLKNRDGRWAGEYCARESGQIDHVRTWRVEKTTDND